MTSRHRRAFGQHFLTNPSITDKIVKLAGVTANETVLEIGPGRGILTDSLLKVGAHVIAVEKDRDLAARLIDKYADTESVEIVADDFLLVDLAKSPLSQRGGVLVIANLPYSVSTEIVFKLIEHRELFSTLTVMVQKEVAERLVAVPGGRDYGVLSVLTQLYSQSQIVLKVGPKAFSPPPKVDSAVVQMKLTDAPRVAVNDEAAFKKLVRQSFAMRRKMLRNCLGIKDEAKWQELCSAVGIDPKARAENVSLEQFANLTRVGIN